MPGKKAYASPPSKTPSRSRVRAPRMSAEARKSQLLRSAILAFSERGIGNANHADVAGLAGVSVPTTFHYFPTSEHLIEDVLKEVHRFLIEEIVASHFDKDISGVEAIESTLMQFCDAIDTHPAYIKIWLEWSVSIRGNIWEQYLTFYEHAQKAVKTILKRGVKDGSVKQDLDIDVSVRVVISLAHMIAQMKFAHTSRKAIGKTVHSLVDGYLAN
ncbi:TetR/AcrR family transcriptional regulator [Marinobacter sp. NP-6]|nr:TetR/AcrR family transcriptional regulator [Marinobacter sp. NP-6]